MNLLNKRILLIAPNFFCYELERMRKLELLGACRNLLTINLYKNIYNFPINSGRKLMVIIKK